MLPNDLCVGNCLYYKKNSEASLESLRQVRMLTEYSVISAMQTPLQRLPTTSIISLKSIPAQVFHGNALKKLSVCGGS